MNISVDAVKELRQRTGAGVMDCKAALEKAKGDMDKACEDLKQKGFASAEKKATRATGQGVIECYIHTGQKVGAMLELNCETDFVARTDQFRQLAHDLAMQITATSPLYVSAADIPENTQVDPVVACLLQQPFIKDPSKTIEEIIKQAVATLGENIRVRRFARFEIGC
ncbi:MAG: translation elongation factor Ts [Chloroflexi bacterium]|nr:translation elongation factor Ts [Chloroflexota bacterium]